jgi:hypothetical protein
VVTGRRNIQYMVAREYLQEAKYKGGIRYACFDTELIAPPITLKSPDTMIGIRDIAKHTYILLFLVRENGMCVLGNRMLAHVCGLNWDVIDPITSALVRPKWSDK